MKWKLATALFISAVLICPAFGQNPTGEKPPNEALSASKAVLQAWNEIGRKLIAMAEDFPENKYDFRQTPLQRTFAEQLLHVAGSNYLFSDVARAKKPVDDESRANYTSKAAVVAYLRKSFEDGAAMIRDKGDVGLAQVVMDSESGQRLPLGALAWELVEHSGEHYGQLVGYYRAAGLVPPESRPKK